MDVRNITKDFAVAGQIEPADLEQIDKAGFGTIICNRPDGESEDQPDWSAIADEAARRGLAVVYNPIASGEPTAQAVEAERLAFEQAEGPVFAYCGSGKRAAVLWALANPDGLSAQDRIAMAGQAGYDIEALRPQL